MLFHSTMFSLKLKNPKQLSSNVYVNLLELVDAATTLKAIHRLPTRMSLDCETVTMQARGECINSTQKPPPKILQDRTRNLLTWRRRSNRCTTFSQLVNCFLCSPDP